MCGIAGWLAGVNPADPAIVRSMTDVMVSRGPDAEGLWADDAIVLGHRRLSIIDLSSDANQPMLDTSGTLAIVFNGEIYNFRELRQQLAAQGAVFRTSGDTEVILESYRAWGDACVERFNGMFAFALWDLRARRLLLARDRLGEKPLFLANLRDGGLLFASEPQALAQHPEVSRSIDPVALGHYLTLNYTLGDRTLRAGVSRLLPGYVGTILSGKKLEVRPYWNLAASFREKRDFRTTGHAAEELIALLDDAVRIRLISDVPLGAFLSGGIDSSAIAAAMVRAVPARQVRTFSIGFEEPGFDEVDAARSVARALDVSHSERIARPEPARIIAAIIRAADEPLADSSVIPTYQLAAFAREHVTVALSGDGGDECFLGYETYIADRMHRLLAWLPKGLLSTAHGLIDRYLPVVFGKVSLDYKLRHFTAGLPKPGPRAHAGWRDIFSSQELHGIMQPAWLAAVRDASFDSFVEFERHFAAVAGCHYLDQASYVDMKTWLPDDILVKVDRATMAHSLESRAPFLDHRMVEFAARLPVGLKLRWLTKKYLLKESQRARLPAWVLQRAKRGFNAPVTQWFEGPLREFAHDQLSSSRLHEWIRPGAIDELWRDQDARRADNGLKLFGLLTLAVWLNQL